MKKTLFVFQQELINTFKRPSYLIFAFGIPLVGMIVFAGVKYFQGRSAENGGSGNVDPVEFEIITEGIVDLSGLIRTIPDDLPDGKVRIYETEVDAQHALEVGELKAYYVVPADYLDQGEVSYVYPDTKSLISDGQEWVIKWVLLVNLLDGDRAMADQVWNPIWHLEERIISPTAETGVITGEDCSRPGFACESNDLIRYLPSIMVALFYVAFLSCSNMLFNSIGIEKENRTIEVLLTSIKPRQLLTGKTTALGLSGLIQMIVWMAAIFIIFTIGGGTLNLPDDFSFPPIILFWSIVFFLGGFAVYATLMAGAGALVPKVKEAGAANFVAMIPLMFGYIVGLLAPIAGLTNNALPVFLSFFPLTAPVVMVMRLTDSIVPFWQPLLSAALLFVSAYFTMRAVSAMFHAQNLLSGQPFSTRRFFKAIAGLES